MYKASVNGREYEIEYDEKNQSIGGKKFDGDSIELKKGKFHIIRDNRSFEAEVVKVNRDEKTVSVKVNNVLYTVSVKDRYDALLKEIGIDSTGNKTVNDIKAPMPGMVLKVIVESGQKIQKGDAMLILEAMKMENILKAPSDGIIKKIHILKGDKVEKNQVLIKME
jgi:biotin carboxyl carrier protein